MIKGKDLEELKVPKVAEIRAKLYEALGKSYAAGKKDSELKPLVGKLAVSANPTEVLEQVDIPEEVRENFKVVAEELEKFRSGRIVYSERKEKAPWKLWGTEKVEARALEQMDEAVSLPISVGGALMPDAHQGYGLPIGGVLATKNAVIPYAVGVDIACRMRISILDIPYEEFEKDRRKFGATLLDETRFGVGVTFEPGKRTHKVMEDPLWRKSGVVKENFKRAL